MSGVLVNNQQSVGIFAGDIGVCYLEKCRWIPGRFRHRGFQGFVSFNRNDFACFRSAEHILGEVFKCICLARLFEAEIAGTVRHFGNVAG